MLSPSVNRFVQEQEKKPDIGQNSEDRERLEELAKQHEEYQYKLHKLAVATKKKNVEAVVSSIDNRYMPEWKENKAMQVNRLQSQVERLKATAEALQGNRPSNSTKPVPIRLRELEKKQQIEVKASP